MFRRRPAPAAPDRSPASAAPATAPAPVARDAAPLPAAYRTAAAYAWRFLVLTAAAVVLGYLLVSLSLVTVSVAVALLVAALLSPIDHLLRRWGLPRAAAAALSFLGGIGVLGALGWLIYSQLTAGLADVGSAFSDGLDAVIAWLENGPLSLDEIKLDELQDSAASTVSDNRADLASGALTVASTLTRFLAGLGLVLFTGFFFLYDGHRIWRWLVRLLPHHVRDSADDAGRHGWNTLVAYMRGTVLVASFDAVLIGIGLLILGVPLAVPLSALVFLGAFVPLVGATVAGVLAVTVALASNGLTTALLTLALILIVQQIEGNVFQPFVLGKMVDIHPVAIVLAVSVGSIVAGIPGAVFAVPVVAVLNAAGSRLAEVSSGTAAT